MHMLMRTPTHAHIHPPRHLIPSEGGPGLTWRALSCFSGTQLGNEYFRRMEQGDEEEEVERRWVEHSSAAYTPEELPVEWQSWLRHTRPQPPSEEEVAALEARRQQVAKRVAVLEAREKESGEGGRLES